MSLVEPVSEESESTVEPDGRVVSHYSRVIRYKTPSLIRPTAESIAADIGILPGSPFPDDPNATCYKIKIKGAEVPTRPPYLAYLVELAWSTNAPLPVSTETDPTTRRTIWSVRPQIQQRYVTKYLPQPSGDEIVIVNTAGQPPDGGIPVDVRLGTAIATRNVSAVGYNRNTVMANSGKVNKTTYLGGAPGTVQVDIEAHEKYEGAFHFYEEVYTFTYDKDGHQPKFPSAGFFQRESVGSDVLVRITEADLGGSSSGDPVQEPEPLDEDGIMVPIADRPDDCHMVEVPYFWNMEFSSFGL